MNTNLHVVLALFLCLEFTAFGIAPPDSTSTLLNRTASFLTVEEGKKAFFQGQTKLALIKFRQAYAKDENNAKAIFWIAKSHYKLNNYGYALEYAKKAEISDPEVDADVYYIIASSFHRKAVLDSALIFYKIAEDKMRNSRFKELGLTTKMKECQTADSLMKIPRKFERKLLEGEVNSGYDDYGPILTTDGNTLYFVSRRNDTQGGGINPDDQTFFEDTYKAVWNKSENKWDSITNDLGKLNSAGFDALNTISGDELTGYLTLNTTALAIKKQTKSSDICSIEMSANAKWGTPKPIKNKSINSSFFDGAATLTADGNTLYFVSDRKGEKYKTDIYVAHKNGRKWGDAVRLPANINTPGFETTPYISEDGLYLFFSSDGLNGMGGYDIYVSEKKANNEWTDPVNLGASFNTVNDDTHFRFYPKLAKAYLSSFRLQDRKSSRDIYEIDMQTFEIPK